jgi:nucleotide-binding universal stress UspA family protein
VARTIVEVGDDYDLLVIGNRGMSGPSRLMGSVSNRIAHNLSTNLLLALTVV